MSSVRAHVVNMSPCAWAAAGALMLAVVTTARAGTFEATLQYTSDYVLRGVSQSDGAAVPQGGLQFRGDGGTFAGVWASPIVFDPENGRRPEVDAYVGHRWQPGARVALQATASRYVFPRDRAPLNYDYSEFAVQVELDDRFALGLAWAPDYSQYSSVGVALNRSLASAELSVRQSVADGVVVNGSVAYYDYTDLFGDGYWAWGMGVAWSGGPWSLTAQRLASDGTAAGWFGASRAGPRWALTVSRRF